MSAVVENEPDAVKNNSTVNSIQEFSIDLLRVYYSRLFPYDAMFDWLSYGNDPKRTDNSSIDKGYFPKREWSFTIEDDIYIRYQSFKDKSEFTAAIQKRQPHKIDIGAVFTAFPKDHGSVKPELFNPVERELVFDIDMTDYDDIRTCCTGANICLKCWPYMTMAVKVVDKALRDDFGFNNILWIYSGRRGVHCWVCDPEARSLNNEARAAIVDYLSVHTGTSENSDKALKKSFNTINMHPSVKRSYTILEPYFRKHIADGKGQGLLASKERYIKILNSLPNTSIRTELYEQWEKNPSVSGAERWRQLEAAMMEPTTNAEKTIQKKRKVNYAELESWKYELVFTHCYPRLDANVSKSMNHLLKSPFCVHPKTGRVCIPIDPSEADSFDPFTVPTVRSLCTEIDTYDTQYDANNNSMDVADGRTQKQSAVADIDKTSLKDAIKIFEKTFMKGMWSSIRKVLRDKSDEIAALNGDF
jgi:DNA primase small subunit